MSRIIGIDLGTTHSLVAVVESGIPLVIADAEGRRLTPSVVHYPASGEPPVVGHAARRVRALHPRETIASVKRFMGRRGLDLTPEERRLPYVVNVADPAAVTFDLGTRTLTPEEVSAEILRKLKRDAEGFLGEPVHRAVITVPAYFNDAQRSATKRAGERAGFTVERILNEPTAAALAYGLNRLKEKSKVAVYDLGGGTFDLSILELHEGVFRVLATHGNTQLGGDDLDAALVRFLAGKIGGWVERLSQEGVEWGKGSAVEPVRSNPVGSPGDDSTIQPGHDSATHSSPNVLARLREAAEQAKIRLSEENAVEISLPFLTPDRSFHHRLTRDELEELTRGLLERTRTHCLRSLADARLEPQDLDQVILVGGQTRMPLVRRLVSKWFGCAEFEETRGALRLGADYHRAAGPQLNTGVNPDEAIALGAAIQAAILGGEFNQMLLLDVTPLSLGLETFGGLMNVIIPRNSTIPVKAGEMFTTAVDGQREMLIHVLQGERERARDNWSLGRFTLEFDPAPRGVPRVGVQFEIDANGILQVLARDTRTGRQNVVDLKSAVDVDDADVQRMVEESVDHAFEDLAARRWVEARLKARALLSATHKGLEDCQGELEASYAGRLREAVAVVQAILDAGNPETETGDVNALQAACGRLDEMSRPLADLLMDKAMEAILRKRGLIS
ncbi:MAG: Hsp70 family protein [Verrucomicrobia bacterium]|jgi:molecular chaperone DnaK|nr:Hsp70 family protein [Verrucomicrobiota bacterium]